MCLLAGQPLVSKSPVRRHAWLFSMPDKMRSRKTRCESPHLEAGPMRRSSLTLESELECVPAGNPDRRSATRPRRLQCARFLCIWHHKSQLHAGSPRQLVTDSTVSMPVAQAFGTRNGARPDSRASPNKRRCSPDSTRVEAHHSQTTPIRLPAHADRVATESSPRRDVQGEVPARLKLLRFKYVMPSPSSPV